MVASMCEVAGVLLDKKHKNSKKGGVKLKAYSNAYNTYKNNSVNYASKEQLLLMLLDGAVKYAKK